MKPFKNPILPGFYPDPSICRVGDDYYMVTSSFEFSPGVPIFHSTDLVHWKQLGHVLDRPSQLNLDGCVDSVGIYAPTIRHSNGVFYMITTLVIPSENKPGHSNFVCTATDPAGPWSEPHWIDDAPGIDPSLFFDASGRAWYHGNQRPSEKQWEYHNQIWLQELDLKTFQLIGEKKVILDAADSVALHGQDFCNAFEAPHLYEKDGWFYQLVSGGGTSWGHSMYIFRSQTLEGPYEPCPANPIMTHRHLPKETSSIHCPGHGDFVQTQTGEWWIVFLATRPYAGYTNYLGRETLMAPMDWSGDWPIVSPATGRIELEYPVPDLLESSVPLEPSVDYFDAQPLGFQWNFIRTPREEWWSLSERGLCLQLRPPMLHEKENPSFVGRRVQDVEFSATTLVDFNPVAENEEAGLVLYKSGIAFFRFVIMTKQGIQKISVIKRHTQDDRDSEMAEADCPDGSVHLRIDTHHRRYRFSYSTDGVHWSVLDDTFDVSCLSQIITGGFTGIYVGPFAGSNGQNSTNRVHFARFEYRGGESSK